MGSASPSEKMAGSMPPIAPKPGIGGGAKARVTIIGSVEFVSLMRVRTACTSRSLPGRSSHGLRRTVIIAWFSPRPPMRLMPAVSRTDSTPGTPRMRVTASPHACAVSDRTQPSGRLASTITVP